MGFIMAKIETLNNSEGVIRGTRMPTGSAPVLSDNAQAAAKPYEQAAKSMGILQDGMKKLQIADLNKQLSTAKTEALAFAHKLSLEAEGMPSKNAVDYFSAGMKEYKEEQAGKEYAPYVRNALDEALNQITVSSGTQVQTSAFRRAIPEQQAVWAARQEELLSQYKKNFNISEFITGKAELLKEVGNSSLQATPELRALEQKKISGSMNAGLIDATLGYLEGLEGNELEERLNSFRQEWEKMDKDGLNVAEIERRFRQLNNRAATEQDWMAASVLNGISSKAHEIGSVDEAMASARIAFATIKAQGNNNPNANKEIYQDIIMGLTGNMSFDDLEERKKFLEAISRLMNDEFGVDLDIETMKRITLENKKNKVDEELFEARERVIEATNEGGLITPKTALQLYNSVLESAGYLVGTHGYTKNELADSLFGDRLQAFANGASTSPEHYDQAKALINVYDSLKIVTLALASAKDALRIVDESAAAPPTDVEILASNMISEISAGNYDIPVGQSPELQKEILKQIRRLPPPDQIRVAEGFAVAGHPTGFLDEYYKVLIESGQAGAVLDSLVQLIQLGGGTAPLTSFRDDTGESTKIGFLAGFASTATANERDLLSMNHGKDVKALVVSLDLVETIMTMQNKDYEKEGLGDEMRKAMRIAIGQGNSSNYFGAGEMRRLGPRMAYHLLEAAKKSGVSIDKIENMPIGKTSIGDLVDKASAALAEEDSLSGRIKVGDFGTANFERIKSKENVDEFDAMAIQNFLSSTVSKNEYISERLPLLTGMGYKNPLARDIYIAQHALNETMYEVLVDFPDAVLDLHNLTVSTGVQEGAKLLVIPITQSTGEFIGYVAYEIMTDKTMKPIAIPDSKGILRRSGGVVSTRYEWQNYGDVDPHLAALEGSMNQVIKIDDAYSSHGENLYAPGKGAKLSVGQAAEKYGARASLVLGPGASPDEIVDYIIDEATSHGWYIVATDKQNAKTQ